MLLKCVVEKIIDVVEEIQFILPDGKKALLNFIDIQDVDLLDEGQTVYLKPEQTCHLTLGGYKFGKIVSIHPGSNQIMVFFENQEIELRKFENPTPELIGSEYLIKEVDTSYFPCIKFG